MESSQSCAARLTHYSTEPLTTGPDFDLLRLLIALAGEVHLNPGTPRYLCSICSKNVSLAKVPATCVQDTRIWYIQDVLVFETLRIIAEPMNGSVPPVGPHDSHVHLPHRLVPPTLPPCQTRRSTDFSGTPMESATNRRNLASSSSRTT